MPIATAGTVVGSALAAASFHGDAVQTIAALKAVTADQRFDKQERYVEDPKDTYYFDAQSAAGESLPDIVAPDAGTGRWIRLAPSGGVPAAHAASHQDGGTDELAVATLAEAAAPGNNVSEALRPDGAGGVAFSDVDHTDLTGVTADQHHAQDHAARHAAATGADALSTAAAGTIAVADAAAVGTAETFARSDHQHALPAPAAPADVTKAAAAAGAATTVARADHKHDVATAAPGAVEIGDSAVEGTSTSLARADHQHSVAAPAAPANVTKAAAAAGVSADAARADHKHDIDTAAPADIGTANAEGSATSVARADHVHDHGAQTTATHHAAASGSVNGFMSSADKTKLDNIALARLQFFADQMDNPNNADWAVNALAPAVADGNNNGLTVRAFDDTTEEGIGFIARPPVGSTDIVLKPVARAETGPPGARTVGLKLYQRGIPDDAAPEAWSAGTVLTDIDIPTTNEFVQYDSQTISLASLGITAGEVTQFELTRVNPAGGTELVGDWNLLELEADFT